MEQRQLHQRKLHSRKPSRGRSTSREGKDKSKITCKYWKAGRCKRGSDCEFSHAGKQKPRKATPARSGSRSSRGSDKKDKRKKDKRGKRDRAFAVPVPMVLESRRDPRVPGGQTDRHPESRLPQFVL